MGWSDFMDLVPAAYFVTDLKGQLLRANRRLADLLGFGSLEHLYESSRRGGGVCAFYRDKEARDEVLARIRSQRTVYGLPIELRRRDDHRLRCSLFAAVRTNGDSPPIYEGFIVDQSERFQAFRTFVDLWRLHDRFLSVIRSPAFSLDEGVILNANAAAADFFGIASCWLMAGRELKEFLHPASHQLAETLLSRLEHDIVDGDMLDAEHMVRLHCGRRRTVRIRATRIRLQDRNACLLTLHDLTRQKASRKALCQARQRIDDILRLAPMGFAVSTPSGRYRRVNRHYAGMYGYASSAEMVADVRDIATQSYARPEDYMDLHRHLAREGAVLGYECQARRRDGSMFWTSRNVREVRDADGLATGYESFVVDIDRRKRSELLVVERELKVRSLTADLMRASEKERERLARSLHDGPVQLLAVSKILIDRIRARSVSCDQDLESVGGFLERSLNMLRSCIVELCPPALLEENIRDMLGYLAREFLAEHGLLVRVDVKLDKALPSLGAEGKAFLYRAAREFLVNAVKHGKAEHADMELSVRDGKLVLGVEDDGCGLDRARCAGNDSTSMGLASLRRLAEDLGGGLCIERLPGGVTRVRLTLPLDELGGRFGERPGRADE